MVIIEKININDIKKHDMIRIANFCEIEFGEYYEYELNNNEGLYEIIDDFELNSKDVCDMLFNNKNIKEKDDFLFYNGHTLSSINIKEMKNMLQILIEKHWCNGELKELIEECLNKRIYCDVIRCIIQ